jgi:hypothetical protein
MIYDVDYKQVIKELYPTHKRNDILLSKVYSLFGDNLNLINTLFKYFRDGATCGNWDNITVYNFQSLVVYQRKVYYKNEITDGYVAGVKPADTTYWIKVLDDFIGLSEKIYFGPQDIILEYALNRIFQTTFRQPSQIFDTTVLYTPTSQVIYGTHLYQRNGTTGGYTPGTLPTNTTYWSDLGFGLSDIYIVTNDTHIYDFFVGTSDIESGGVMADGDLINFSISSSDVDTTIKDFTVFVPNSVLATLGGTLSDQKAVISSAVNNYKLSGYIFDVQGY